MNEEKIREEFAALQPPEMKPEILAKLHEPKRTAPRRRIRPALLAAAALILVLTAAVGAAVSGTIQLIPGSRVYFWDDDGNIVKPQGFYPEQAADVQLSEQALANIAPYVFVPGPNQEATVFETASRAEMEALIDMPLILPEAIEKIATGYRLWATGANGEAASIYVQIQLNGNWGGNSMNVFLRGTMGTYVTGSEPEMSAHPLSDGSAASLAAAKSSQSGKWSVFAFYTRDGAIYSLRMHGGKSKNAQLREAKAILDTLQ